MREEDKIAVLGRSVCPRADRQIWEKNQTVLHNQEKPRQVWDGDEGVLGAR